MSRPDMILGDWGTTRLRLFRMESGRVAEHLHGPGIGQLTGSPAETLATTIAPWRAQADGGVLLCGMAGSRNGLVEVPYAPCPAGLADWARATAAIEVGAIPVRVAAGLRTSDFTGNFAGAPDVMRGEEAQIFGAIAAEPALARGRHLIILPGTHSKWAELVDGRVERFHSFLTGELFALLRDHSTLTRAGADMSGRKEGFAAGLARIDAAKGLLGSLFEARAAQLIEGRSHGWALGLLSGLVIGAEIAQGLALAGAGLERLILVGDPDLSALYEQAIAARNLSADHLDGDACAIGGLTALAAHMDKETG